MVPSHKAEAVAQFYIVLPLSDLQVPSKTSEISFFMKYTLTGEETMEKRATLSFLHSGDKINLTALRNKWSDLNQLVVTTCQISYPLFVR